MFAAEIRKKRVARLRGFPPWRWHLDEVFVKINGKLRYLWRAVDHEGEVLETVVTAKRDKAAALKLLKRIMPREIWPTAERRHRRALLLSRSDERDRQTPTVTRLAVNGLTIGRRIRTSHFDDENEAMQLFRSAKTLQKFSSISRAGQQSFRPGASPRHPRGLQTETLGRVGRAMARPRGLATDWPPRHAMPFVDRVSLL